MLAVDMRLEELKGYKPKLTKRDDFDNFWQETLDESKQFPLNSDLKTYEYPIKEIKVFDAYYDGFKGSRINGWYILPNKTNKKQKIPALIYFHGYTRSKGYIQDYLKWVIQGYAVFAVNVRGQGGTTPDSSVYSQGGITGWMTNGILDKYEYYYRNVYMDCVRAVDFIFEDELLPVFKEKSA